MNNLLSQLLMKLAEKEVGEKELNAKIELLETLVFSIISMLDDNQINELTKRVECVLAEEPQRGGDDACLTIELLTRSINRFTTTSIRN
ncbi:sigma-S stabilization anti-adapter protein IraP [Brenneria populi subsp. brevivirga]|uniref:sigma-S stabilization anti-adapter protein IraP n=1 Tax=Brenneria populi TaxID=1505588 RepID=UPI002E183CE1|nr:sigma-S stabilization anti-adapter protein IraP [Brenneria populi subsp. brevivirga]